MTNKKIFRVLALAAFVAMVVIAPLQAAPDCQKKGDQEKKMDKECAMKAEGCMMLKNIPNLSDEQKAKLEKLQAECQKMMETAKADMEKQAMEMKALMKDPVDLKKAEAKIDEIAMMKAGMQKKCLAHRFAVRALLTAEQKAKFDEMGCCGMMGEKGCMKGGMKEHGKKMNHGKNQKAEEEEEKEEVKK
ncbi:MAG TPA: periplasmic heavy metal sensor [Acidobacteriota bacterium]